MALVLKRNRRASAMCTLVTESIAQEGIDLLRTHLPDAQIDATFRSHSGTTAGGVGQYTAPSRGKRKKGH